MNINDIKHYLENIEIEKIELHNLKLIIEKKLENSLKETRIEKSFRPSSKVCPTCGK